MGAYLSQPITEKESTDGEDARFKYGTTAMQGWRTNMEVRERRDLRARRRRERVFENVLARAIQAADVASSKPRVRRRHCGWSARPCSW